MQFNNITVPWTWCPNRNLIAVILLSLFLIACGREDGEPTDDPATPNNGGSGVAACLDGSSGDMAFVNANLTTESTLPKLIKAGKMYDKWYVASESTTTDPADLTDHPLWDTRNVSGAKVNNRGPLDNWRCKECHGWDYLGNLGAYNETSSHYTNFKGVAAANSMSALQAFCAIKYGSDTIDHGFSTHLENDEILNLAAFVTNQMGLGVIDVPTYVNSNKTVNGDPMAGKAHFTGLAGCDGGACHLPNGFGQLGGISLGDVAWDNPWETLHKIRYGHPNTLMPSIHVTVPGTAQSQAQAAADVVAYARTELPLSAENCETDSAAYVAQFIGDARSFAQIVKAGQMYDKWWTVINAAEPAGDHPIWAARATDQTNTPINSRGGSTSWRCKECHGWDYIGPDGHYGAPGTPKESNHYTNFPGILATKSMTPVQAFCAIKMGTKAMTGTLTPDQGDDAQGGGTVSPGSFLNHAFYQVLTNDDDILALAAFITDTSGLGLIDPRPTVMDIPNADTVLGESYFQTKTLPSATPPTVGAGCFECHDPDGLRMDNFATSAGKLSNENPWEFLHKVRYGQPASSPQMPSIYAAANSLGTARVPNSGIIIDARDIIGYAQTLPFPDGTGGGGGGGGGGSSQEIVAGGQLYDNWPVITGQNFTTNPDWAGGGSVTGNDTWRCANCHGWDYKGVSGGFALETGALADYFTGTAGLMAASTMAEPDIVAKLDGNSVPEVHNFAGFMSPTQITQLAQFITSGLGVIDISPYIDTFKWLDSNGVEIMVGRSQSDNAANGVALYNSNADPKGCASWNCHGDFGNGVFENPLVPGEFNQLGPVVDMSAMARSNPWRVFHKTRFGDYRSAIGQLGRMPIYVLDVATDPNLAASDVLGHIQLNITAVPATQ